MSIEQQLSTQKEAPRLEELIEKTPIVSMALELAKSAHEGQSRLDGTAYITHPIEVTRIIYEEWGISNGEVLAAAILHDVEEDTDIGLEEIKKKFGKKVRDYVDGVTKFSSEKASKEDISRETIKKIYRNNLFDPIPSLIKLADRLHNMRTMKFVPAKKQSPKAMETSNIYCPLAESLGLWKVKTELEDLSFKYIDPQAYKEFKEMVGKDKRMDIKFRTSMAKTLEEILLNAGINASVSERINSLARLRAKSDREGFLEINDLISFRVVVDDLEDEEKTLPEVYKSFGIIRNLFSNIEEPERLDDFYIDPRENKYSAIQLTLNIPGKGAVEIAITSKKKEDFNNWGVVSLLREGVTSLKNYSLKLVITPRGVAKFTTPNATGVDVAYLINSDFGLLENGILINGKRKRITDIVPNGADIDILEGPQKKRPDPALIRHARLPRTKRLIEKQNKSASKESTVAKGRKLVDKAILSRGIINLRDMMDLKVFPNHSIKLIRSLHKLGCRNDLLGDLYYRIGSGRLKIDQLDKYLDEINFTKKSLGITSIYIEGVDKPGLLSQITSAIKNEGGNIRINYGTSNAGGRFAQRFVIESLSQTSEEKLQKLYNGMGGLKRVLIV